MRTLLKIIRCKVIFIRKVLIIIIIYKDIFVCLFCFGYYEQELYILHN